MPAVLAATVVPEHARCGVLWRRQLRQLWPLLAGVPLLLALALLCQELLATSAAMQRGQGRWAQASFAVTRALDQYAHTCQATHREHLGQQLARLQAYAEVRMRIQQTPPDFDGAAHAYRRADPDATLPELRLRLMHGARDLTAVREAFAIWTDAAQMMATIQVLSDRIVRRAELDGCAHPEDHAGDMLAVHRIEDRMAPLLSAFGDSARRMNERMGAAVQVILLGAGAMVLLLGLVLARRTVHASQRMAIAEHAGHLARQRSMQALRQLMGTLGDAPGAGQPARPEANRPQDSDIDDILQQVQRLADRQRADQRALQAIFDRSPDAFVLFGSDGRVSVVSAAFTPMTGRTPAEVMGLSEAQLLALLAGSASTTDAALQVGAAPADLAGRQLTVPGPPERVLALIPLQQGQPAALCLRDVTRAQALERMKSEFITSAAHELRTPMASILGFVELLRNRVMADARRAEVLDIVLRQSHRMADILNDLLDLSRLESRGRAALQAQRLDLQRLLEEAVQAFPCPAGRDRPQLRLEGAPAWVQADPQLLLRVMDNLLSNAYKFSPAGGAVQLQLLRRDAPDGSTQVGVCVQDHGIGITPAQLLRVGERFYRADASGHIPGTGLGISLVREILQLHGGSLDLQSEAGVGTRCTAWLPAAA